MKPARPGKAGLHRLTKGQIARAMELRTHGLLYREIAGRLRVSKNTLYDAMRKAEHAGFKAWEGKVILKV